LQLLLLLLLLVVAVVVVAAAAVAVVAALVFNEIFELFHKRLKRLSVERTTNFFLINAHTDLDTHTHQHTHTHTHAHFYIHIHINVFDNIFIKLYIYFYRLCLYAQIMNITILTFSTTVMYNPLIIDADQDNYQIN